MTWNFFHDFHQRDVVTQFDLSPRTATECAYVTFHPITFSNIRKAYMIQLVEVFVTVQQQIFFPTIKENCQLIVLLQMV